MMLQDRPMRVCEPATTARPDWALWAACVEAVFAGSQLGSNIMATRLKSGAIKKIVALTLLLIAAILIVKNIIPA